MDKRRIKEYALITVGTVIAAAAVYFLMVPSHVTVGSISGLAMVISHFIPLPISVITLIFNVVLLVISFLLMGRDFGAKTVYGSLLLPAAMWVFEELFPDRQSFTGDQLLDVLCYVFVVSVGLAMLFVCNASSGGLDTIAKLLNKFLRMDLGQAISAVGICAALSSALVYDKKTVVLSVIGTYLNGVIVDHFVFGINLKRRVCILSSKMEEIRQFILYDLHSGATIYEAAGALSGEIRREIVVIVDKAEYAKLMDYVQKLDPAAFITVYAVNEVTYQPKRALVREEVSRQK